MTFVIGKATVQLSKNLSVRENCKLPPFFRDSDTENRLRAARGEAGVRGGVLGEKAKGLRSGGKARSGGHGQQHVIPMYGARWAHV